MRIGNPDLGEELAPGIAALMWGSAEEEEEEEEENVEEEWNGDDMEFISFFVSIKEKRDVDSVRERERERERECVIVNQHYVFIFLFYLLFLAGFFFFFLLFEICFDLSPPGSQEWYIERILKKKRILWHLLTYFLDKINWSSLGLL